MPMPHKQTEPVALVLALAGTVHAGRHSSTLKALRITMVGPYSQALLTLYGPPDCRRRYTEGPGDLVRIALYLYDPHLNNLKGGNCGPVSQTRVCDTTPAKGDASTWTAPLLTQTNSEDLPAQVSPLGLLAGFHCQIADVQRLPARVEQFSATDYTLEADFCVDASKEALGRSQPEGFNTD